MPTYLGWNVVTMPGTPAAPAAVEFSVVNIISGNTSPFTGQMQIYDWGANYMEANVTLPPLTLATADPWIAFFRACKGIGSVFQFSTAFMAAYPTSVGTRYWRMKNNVQKWSINQNRFVGMQFECREAI